MTTNPAVEIDLDKQRAEFEAWALSDDSPAWLHDIRRHNDGYVHVIADVAWAAYQEASRRRAAPVAQQSEAGALLNADEMSALRRFKETCDDGEGYDVPKAMMKRLAEIGVVRCMLGSYYQTTDFGMRVLEPVEAGAPTAAAELVTRESALQAIEYVAQSNTPGRTLRAAQMLVAGRESAAPAAMTYFEQKGAQNNG